MKNLANQIIGNDVFVQQTEVSEDIISEYFMRNERKKEDEKWLKANKTIIMQELERLGKQANDWGDFRVSYVEPDNSTFDMEKVLDYVLEFHPDLGLTKLVVDEEKLTAAIEEEKVDLESLKVVAWKEQKGSPRLTVKKMKK